jgi:hypothetical protein
MTLQRIVSVLKMLEVGSMYCERAYGATPRCRAPGSAPACYPHIALNHPSKKCRHNRHQAREVAQVGLGCLVFLCIQGVSSL